MPLRAFIQKTHHKRGQFSDTCTSPNPRAPCPARPRAQGEGEPPAPRFLQRELILDKAPLAPARGWRVGICWKLGGQRGSGKHPRLRPQPGSPHPQATRRLSRASEHSGKKWLPRSISGFGSPLRWTRRLLCGSRSRNKRPQGAGWYRTGVAAPRLSPCVCTQLVRFSGADDDARKYFKSTQAP